MISDRRIINILVWLFIAIIIVLLLIRLAAPYGIQYGFNSWFEQQGVEAHIGEVSMELIDGSIQLKAVTAERDDKRVFGIGILSVAWSWHSLFDNDARLTDISLSGLELEVVKQASGSLMIAGIDLDKLSSGSSEEPTSKGPPPQWQTHLHHLRLSDSRLCYRDEANAHLDYCATVGELDWTGDIGFDLSAVTADTVPLSVNGVFYIDQLDIQDKHVGRDLLSFSRLQLDTLSIDTLNSIHLDDIALNKVQIMQREQDYTTNDITSIRAINIVDISLDKMNTLNIDQINIDGHQLYMQKDRNGAFEFSQWLPAPADEPDTAEPATVPVTDSAPFHYRLGKFSYTSDQQVVYADNSLAEPFEVTLSDMTMSIDNIDSAHPEQKSNVSYSALYHEHGKISLEGTVTPLAARKTFDIKGDISGIDLRNVSAFTKSTIGYSIKSGQLDTDITLKADNNILDSKLDIGLYQFELKAISAEDEKKMNSSMGFPLSTSLSLLRDRDNAIRLELPITGDLDSPDFDPADAISKATSKAITYAVINYYTPFGLVMAADGLLSLATALSFDPVTYTAGSHELNDDARQQLSRTLTLMQERPGVHLTLCGFTSAADAAALIPERKADKDGKLPPLTSAQASQLTTLGEQRADTLKKYLVNAGVAAKRLILCAPEHSDDPELAGRVEISI